MGYTTNFRGGFKLSRPLTVAEAQKLVEFSEERHGDNVNEFTGFPSFYCDWVPNKTATEIVHNGDEKFYGYVRWLEIIMEKFLRPWGVELSGRVLYRGESLDDIGYLIVENGKVRKEPLQV